jgi:hypothetical protein
MLSCRPKCGIFRLAALVLLLWTAVDLADINACALDNLGIGRSGSAAGVIAPTDAMAATPAAHVDDCFCCSACVEPRPISAPLETPGIAVLYEHTSTSFVSLLGNSLFHPPQLA